MSPHREEWLENQARSSGRPSVAAKAVYTGVSLQMMSTAVPVEHSDILRGPLSLQGKMSDPIGHTYMSHNLGSFRKIYRSFKGFSG